MKKEAIIYWVATALLCLLVLGSAGMYIMNYDSVSEIFEKLGHPAHVIYPLALAKILAVVAILTKKSATLKEWAYAGLFFDFVLAFMAHYYAADGEYAPALVALVLLFTSYFMEKKAFSQG